MLSAFIEPKNIENFSFTEQKRIIITSKISLVGIGVMVFYLPYTLILHRIEWTAVTIFTAICFSFGIYLNKKGKHLLAKLMLCIEPIFHIAFIELTQGNMVHLYNIVIISVPFLVFSYQTEKHFIYIISGLNLLSLIICQGIVYFPEFNPFLKKPVIWWFEYSNWITSGIVVSMLVHIFSRTSNEQEQKLLDANTQMQEFANELQYAVKELQLSEMTLAEQKESLEKLNQELVAREEELKQNLEELQTTQETLVKEKQLAEQLKERFELAIEGTNDGIWDWDLKTNYVFYSPKWKSMLGYAEEELKNELSTFSELIHPDHIQTIFAEVENYLKGNIPKYEVEIPMRTRSGEYKWILSKGTALRDSEGNPYRMLGSHTDITERKIQQEKLEKLNQELIVREIELKKNVEELTYLQEQMLIQNKALIETRKKVEQQNQELVSREEELRQNLEELHATQEQMRLAQQEAERNAMNANKIFEAAPIGLFISKVSNRTIVQANQAMAKLLKIPVYEIIGRATMSFYASEEQAKAVFAELVEKGQFSDKEIDIKLDDGSVITTLVSAQIMTLNNEKVIVAGLNDITELKKAQAELADLANNLTKRVEEQTEEIKRSFAQMVQNEKMAALGQLVAGVAHEINTPIGAIKASAENMQENLPNLIEQTFSTPIPDNLVPLFDKAVKSMLNERTSLTSREERTYRKQITEILEQNNIENAADIAFALVQVGLVKNIEEYIPVFEQQNYEEILTLISRIGRLKVNIDTILIATNKTKKIVSALKSYVHKQAEDVLVPTNINESIETVLVLYHNQIKHGVEVATEFDELPDIHTYADELSQVWTNLIVNALQAMQYKGRLHIKTKQENDHILISITDNGPGIPQEIQNKIFEPFFTTKSQGEGTGLGLDICKKIIEKHNGTMYFTSEPGNTTFYISLPLYQTSHQSV